jgi:hypothetical protein
MVGVDAAKKGLAGMEKTMKKELKKEFQAIGVIVADEAKSIAESKGLRGTLARDKHKGLLIKSIKPQATAMKVVINETARTKGYNYPKVYEYGGRMMTAAGKGKAGNRTTRMVKNRSETARSRGLTHGSSEGTGSREFMHPALVAKKPEVMRRMQGVIAKMAGTFLSG